MLSATDTQRIKDFLEHLYSNPNIKSEPYLIGEGLLLNFIASNIEQLKSTFKTPQFFPHLEWNQVLPVLVSELYQKVSSNVLPVLTDFIDSIDYDVLNKVSQVNAMPEDFQNEKLKYFINEIFRNKDVRYNLNSVVNIYKYNIIEKYMAEVFGRRDYIYNEIVRVQKTNLDEAEYIVYLKVLLLIKNAAYVKYEMESANRKLSVMDSMKVKGKFDKYLEEIIGLIRRDLSFLSDKTIKLALKSNFKSDLTDLDEGASRLLFIFSSRYHNYKPQSTIDRGAESPDKSWFAVSKNNYSHYGFDKRMMEELYRISGDNNW